MSDGFEKERLSEENERGQRGETSGPVGKMERREGKVERREGKVKRRVGKVETGETEVGKVERQKLWEEITIEQYVGMRERRASA